MIVDSHCHLDYEQLYNNLDEVIGRANSAGVKNLLTICTTLNSYKKIKFIVKKYKNIYGTFGIHPHETKNHTEINCDYILKAVKNQHKIIGIGETGLDFYYNHSDKKIQQEIFIQHIHAASKLKVPVIVHSRNAEDITYKIISQEKKKYDVKVLIHCFTGSKDFAKKLIDINCAISVSGIITFKNTDKLAEAVSIIPLNNLLVETDSPYLSPLPHRGKSNEPSYIIHTIDRLSRIKNVSKEEIISVTTKNFNNLFNIA